MDDDLIFASLFISTVGLFMLFALSAHPQQPVKISDITYEDIGKGVFIKGTVMEKKVKDDNVFLKVGDDSGVINVVLFKFEGNVTVNSTIEVGGRVDEFNGMLEIVPKRGEDVRCSG